MSAHPQLKRGLVFTPRNIKHARILEIIATSGFSTALECTKLFFGLGLAPNTLGSLQRSTRPWLKKALLLRGREEKG